MTAPQRRWFTFSLRTLFAVLTVLALTMGAFAWLAARQRLAIQQAQQQVEQARAQARAARAAAVSDTAHPDVP